MQYKNNISVILRKVTERVLPGYCLPKGDDITLKQQVAFLIWDLPLFVWSIRPSWLLVRRNFPWVYIRNHWDRLIYSKDEKGVGFRSDTALDLRVANFYPSMGLRLMKRALRDWPVAFSEKPEEKQDKVEISFIIGFRGRTRLANLLTSLRSIAAQVDVLLECIVVEQAVREEIRADLPAWVRYIHTSPPDPDMLFNRSWALNVGARAAHGKILVFHDCDVCVPIHYARELLVLFNQGVQVMRLQRFVFFLDESASGIIVEKNVIPETVTRNTVVQNSAGCTMAAARDAFFGIGGFDEAFVGWGWEDNEFSQRFTMIREYSFMYLPFIHLHHDPQPEAGRHNNHLLFHKRSAISPEQRVEELKARHFGNPAKPYSSYAASPQ